MSYLELLNQLKETVKSDVALPESVKKVANKLLDKLFNTLWSYSD